MHDCVSETQHTIYKGCAKKTREENECGNNNIMKGKARNKKRNGKKCRQERKRKSLCCYCRVERKEEKVK